MVYRGKPSAGCENCRKAKKRCGLEQPACSRCAKLKKTCSGYRDTTELQIQDESEAVRIKANRRKARTPGSSLDSAAAPLPLSVRLENGMVSSGSNALPFHSESSPADIQDTTELPRRDRSASIHFNAANGESLDLVDLVGLGLSPGFAIPCTLKTRFDDLAVTYFFSQFTTRNGHWSYLRQQAIRSSLSPLIQLAVRACGTAALENLNGRVVGREYSRSIYARALGLLNAALRDPKDCRTDESLIAVSMLGYYENLICDSRESIQSWKTHTRGATHLLKLRGKNQFKTQLGRMLWRETRAQILINCMWDDTEPPLFLWEWHFELERQTPDFSAIRPADELSLICFDFATMRSRMCHGSISDSVALVTVAKLETRIVQWSVETMSNGELWQYYNVEVPDSQHVWDGVVHAYNEHPAASVWNTYRSMRIFLTRTQEGLIRRSSLPAEEVSTQMKYFRTIRRQMTDDICAATPHLLGHAAPAPNSQCILVAAYSAIWPLFFAGTCALERMSMGTPHNTSAAAAQVLWIIGRLEYVSKHVGLRWADGVAATLRGDIKHHHAGLADSSSPFWIAKVEQSGRGPRVLLMPDTPLTDALAQPRSEFGPIWLGRTSGENTRVVNDTSCLKKENRWPID